MSILLMCMPTGDMTQPYTALPSLTAHLRARGVDVTQCDMGISFANYWATGGRTRLLLAELDRMVDQLDAADLTIDDWEDYVDLRVMRTLLGEHADDLGDVLGQLRRPDVVEEMGRLGLLLRVLAAYQGLLSLAERSAFGDQSSFQALSVEAGLRALANPPRIHQDFLKDVLAPTLRDVPADLVGISITYPRQLYPSLLACQEVRRARPDAKIVLGGAYLSTIAETLEARPELASLWDFAVVGEGETALTELAEVLRTGGDFGAVPNLVYQDGTGVVRSRRHHDEDLDTLETPDFSGLDLEAYLAPTPVFLLPVARGCYMRCTFCSISYATRRYRARDAQLVVQDIKRIQAQFGLDRARHFNFSIDVMAPGHLTEMSTAFERAQLDIVWDAEIRFDRGLQRETLQSMRRSGCRHLRFGLESAVDRIRDLMDKRIDISRVRQILEICRAEDIKASTMIIIGFPGEQPEEAEQTFQFLSDNNDKIRYFALNVYTVSRGSIIEKRAEDFGVQLHARPDRLVQPAWDFDILRGITTAQAQRLAAEFRNRLTERYPLAEEGFSVGIGGAFTFLTSARWTFEELLRFDQEAIAPPRHTHAVGSSCVPTVNRRVHAFAAPFVSTGVSIDRKSDPTHYLVTPRNSLLRFEGASARVTEAIDGSRTIAEISRAADPDGGPLDDEDVAQFLARLSEAGVLEWSC